MSADQAPISVDLAGEPDFTLGALRVRPSLREVVDGGEREVLEPRVMQVLVVLARRRGQVVSRDQLIEACWAGRVVGEDAINRCIARVRRLAEAHGSFSIETIARVGYRLTEQPGTAEPREHDALAVAPVISDAAAVERHSAPQSSPTVPATDHLPPTGSRRSRLIAAVAAAVLLAAAAYIGVTQLRAREQAQQLQATVLTQIAELVREDRYGAAFVLARPLSRLESVRTNPTFAKLWRQIVIPMKPLVAQPGATVYFRPYDDVDGEWIPAGTTHSHWNPSKTEGVRWLEFIVAEKGKGRSIRTP